MAIAIRPIESKDVWERFVLATQPTALFQSWLWGEVEQNRGITLWRFGVFRESELIGVFQVFKVTAKRGTFLHVRHGPVLTHHSIEMYRTVLSHLTDLAGGENAWFIRMSPQIPDSPADQRLLRKLSLRPSAIHAMDAEHCWVLDITASEPELLAGMRKTTRYEIRRAERLGVNVRASTDPKDLIHFSKLYKFTSQRQGFVPHRGIEEEFKAFTKAGMAVLFLGSYKNNILAAAIILYYGPQAIYHHAASVPTHIPVSYLVQWSAIKEAKKRGKKVYNFWGIAPDDSPNHPWRGITLFKKGFGGKEAGFIHAHDLPLSPLYTVSRMVETIRKRVKHY